MPPDVHVLQNPAPRELVQSLRDQIARMEGARRPASETPVSSGCAPLDKLLPAQGFHRGTLVEWLTSGEGSGAESLVFLTAREACWEGGALVVFDQAKQFYPPAAVRLGIPPEGMIVVQAASQADNLWALDQALRCAGVAAAVAWPEKLDGRTFRRLQLAAEQGGGLGLLVRSERARHEPSWAEVRLAVEPLPAAAPDGPRRLKILLLRTRGGPGSASAEVEIDHETHPLYLGSPLAYPAPRRRAAGA
jgi:hypothetical protein